MVNFAKYYIEFLRALFNNFGEFFSRLWTLLSDALFNDIIEYFKILISHWSGFTFIDWLFEVIAIVINVGFFGFFGLRVFQLLRRYIRFVRREIEKDLLMELTRGNGARAGRGGQLARRRGVKVSSPEACSSHLRFPSPPSCRSINHVSRLPFYSKPSSSSLIIVICTIAFYL